VRSTSRRTNGVGRLPYAAMGTIGADVACHAAQTCNEVVPEGVLVGV
jgi:hypothetical protein